MFCAPGFVFGGTEGVGTRFHVLRAQTHFWRYRGRRVPFAYFARSNSFSAVSCASGSVLMSCSRTHFRRYRGHQDPFSCFALLDSFSTIPRASGLVFMFCTPELVFHFTDGVGSLLKFCAPGLIFGGTEGVRSRFHVLRARTRIRRYEGRRVPFSSFARPDSFSAVQSASDIVFMFCVPGLIFGGIEGVGSRFNILHARTQFRRYRGRRVQFSCFTLTDSFSAVVYP
jgi:hypothetical protein